MSVNKKYKENYKISSPTKRKVLLILKTGIEIGLTRSVSKQSFLIKKLPKELKQIDRQYLYQVLNEFKYNRLIDYQELSDGKIKMVLNEAGKVRALKLDIDNIVIENQKKWDGRWRLVIFDVPEKIRKGRDALRDKLKELGFHEWQKSAWIYPYPCRDQIDFITEFFDLRNHVRYGELLSPTNEAELKIKFDLS